MACLKPDDSSPGAVTEEKLAGELGGEEEFRFTWERLWLGENLCSLSFSTP